MTLPPLTIRDLARRYRLIVPFVVVYMIAFGIAALVQHNAEFVYYTVVMLVLISAIAILDRRVLFSKLVLWGLAIWGLGHMAGGTIHIPGPDGPMVPYLYRPHPDLPRYDQAIHAYGFAIATVACWEALAAAMADYYSAANTRARPSLGLALAAVLMSTGLGAINELIEFIATRILAQTNIGGYDNTGWDLVSNLVGTLAAGLVLLVRRNNKPPTNPQHS